MPSGFSNPRIKETGLARDLAETLQVPGPITPSTRSQEGELSSTLVRNQNVDKWGFTALLILGYRYPNC